MKRPVRICLMTLLACVLLACSNEKIVKKFIPDDVEQYARDYIETVRSGNLSESIKQLDPGVFDISTGPNMQMVKELLNHGEVISTEIISGYFYKFRKLKGEDCEDCYDFDRYIMDFYVQYSSPTGKDREMDELSPQNPGNIYHQNIRVIVEKRENKTFIYGFHVNELPDSPGTINKLSFRGKPLWQLLYLATAAMVPVFILYTIWVCVRTPMKRKWLWIIFISLGLGKMMLNWSTGEITGTPLAVQLLGAGVYRWGLYGPWHVTLAWPMGAVLFYFKRY